jgi:AAA15 family ATPase/GTPase
MANAITRVEIKDFLVFKGEFTADFCPGVNVLIGGNGTGKTTLMRAMYGKNSHFQNGGKTAEFRIFVDGNLFSSLELIKKNGAAHYLLTAELTNIVFIPESNLISHSRGLPETVKYGKLNYSVSEIDIVEKARVLPSVPKQPLVQKIEDIIEAEARLADDGQSFLVKRKDLEYEIELLFEASGYQKLILLALLVRNEQIKPGSILFWDEPENSLNPELIPALVDILLELQRSGIQIFVATHNFDVARWIELNKQPGNTLRYFNLRKEGGRIVADVADNYETLPRSVIDEADDVLLRRSVQAAAASAGVKLNDFIR